MKKWLSKLGINKMDEMEKDIAMRSQRIALVYVVISLVAWTFYESYKVKVYHTPINLAPCFLLVTTNLVLIFSQLIIKHRAVSGDEEYNPVKPLVKFILSALVIAGVIASVGAFLLLKRV